MKSQIFDAMSKGEAQEYLDEFVEFGKNLGIEILETSLHFTIDLDFSLASLPIVFKALIPTLKTVPRAPDPSVPEFIRKTDDYQKGLFDFDENSKLIVLATAYYLGETLIRNFSHLRWATGDTEYLQSNSPVVTGFKFKKELPAILISENIFSSVISGLSPEQSIDTAIEVWSTKYV